MGWFGKRKEEKKKKQEELIEKESVETKNDKTTKAKAKTETQTEKTQKTSATEKKAPRATTPRKTTVKRTIVNTKKEEEKPEEIQVGGGKKPLYRVIYDKEAGLWKIKKDGAQRTIAYFRTKESALTKVKLLSESKDLNYIVHKKDGKFQKK